MKSLVVQKRLEYSSEGLQSQSGTFVKDVQQIVQEARARHADQDLELADIGFVPAADYIEVKLYFRQREAEE